MYGGANPMVGGGIGATAPMSAYPQTSSPTVPGTTPQEGASVGFTIDGTPFRVVSLAALAIFGLWGLKQAGIKFNVVSG